MFLKKVLFLLGNRKRKLPVLIILFIFSSFLDVLGVGLIIPYMSFVVSPELLSENRLFMVFSDFVDNKENILIYMSLILVTVFLIKTISAIVITRGIIKFSLDFGVELRSLLMKSYQSLPYTTYTQKNSSEYVYRIQSHTDQISQHTISSILRIISEGLITLMLFAFLIITSGVLVFYLIVFLGLIVLSYDLIFRKRIKIMGQKVAISQTAMVKGIYEGMAGFKEIKVLGKHIFFYNKVHTNSQSYADVKLQHKLISSIPRFFMELILVCVVVFLVLSFSVSGESTIDALPIISAFGVASLRLMPSISQIIASSTAIRFGKHAVDIIFKDIQSFDIVKNDNNNNNNINAFKSFELKNISFSYPNISELAINNLSMKILNGSTIGIIGSSGSGKTTLVDILLGLLKPDSGEILYDGKLLNNNSHHWTDQVAYLPQQVFLIDDSIEKNIALGVEYESIDKAFIDLAIKKSSLSELIKSLPEGVDTNIGENGVRLSGGQRQRIALARAFYHNRNILVLDESTSALDQETEREIVKEIQNLKGDKTMIIIAHRLNTLEHCDIIYKIEKGKIVSSRSFKDIMNT